MDKKLLSCPHCGGEADCNDSGVCRVDGAPLWWVECLGCGCNTAGHDTEDEAVTAWNKRALLEWVETGCEFCQNFEFARVSAVLERMGERVLASVVHAGGSSRFPAERQFKFCPCCGRAVRED
jgi:hypothetical protein